jgi:hypothetical protein
VHWTESRRESAETYRAIVFGAGRFVAVGTGVATTTDGLAWREFARPAVPLETLAFGHERFVAVAGTRLFYSESGESFSSGIDTESLPDARCFGLACGDTEAGYCFVAVGDSEVGGADRGWRGASSNGESWNAGFTRDTPLARSVAYGGGQFVVAGPNGLIESSHDGHTWVRRTPEPTEDFLWVIWTGERFVARGHRAWTSPDGFTWSPAALELPVTLGCWSAGLFEFIPNGRIFFSADLVTWERSDLPVGPRFFAVARLER